MGSYNILTEHGLEADAREISTNPHWIILIVRYDEPLTASKARLANRTEFHTGNISLDDDVETLIRTRESVLISSDCSSVDVDSTKARYTQTLQAVLKPGMNYLSAVMPGDWVFCWMMNSEEKYTQVLGKLKEKKAANDFDDGLKFMGRVQDIRKVLMQSPGGLKTVQFNLQAVGFGELDSATFFDPALARREPYIEKYLQNMNIPMKEIYSLAAEGGQKSGGVDINKVMPALIRAFIGDGLSGVGVAAGGITIGTGAAIATKDAPYAYVVPDGIASILGVDTKSKAGGVYSYADLLTVIQGRQMYEGGEFPQMFFPDGTASDGLFGFPTNRHRTSHNLTGLFLPMPTSFDGKTVWNLLNEYLNPAMNEMYTAMKYTPSRKILPTLVIRQLPFSSPVLTQKLGSEVTCFHELPRWKAEPLLIRGLDIGRSDSERINFVHIYGIPTNPTLKTSLSSQVVRYPPIGDPQDIKRHGLRPHFGQVNVSSADILTNGPARWMTVRSDILMGQHLLLTGMCSMVGVTSPICPGDNFEFEDGLYHIESVRHHCEIQPDGTKSFTTQLGLSHGVRADIPTATGKIPRKKVRKSSRVHGNRVSGDAGVARILSLSGHARDETENAKFKAFLEAKSEHEHGAEIEVLEGGRNPDIDLYNGVHDGDNVSQDPGINED